MMYFIDLFCGAGGVTSGVLKAKKNNKQIAQVIACVNHDETAIASHKANHGEVLHFIEDIRILDISPIIQLVNQIRIIDGDAIICLWASLECTNFSKAKGGQPCDTDSRTLAEHLFRYIEGLNTDLIYIENVEEFMALYNIVDIKMRMLKVNELLKIQGFDANYILLGNQSQQKKMIGNSCEVNQIKALIESSFEGIIESLERRVVA